MYTYVREYKKPGMVVTKVTFTYVLLYMYMHTCACVQIHIYMFTHTLHTHTHIPGMVVTNETLTPIFPSCIALEVRIIAVPCALLMTPVKVSAVHTPVHTDILHI